MNKGSKWSKYKNKATGDIVEKYENGSNVVVTNFIEFKTEKDFMDFKGE